MVVYEGCLQRLSMKPNSDMQEEGGCSLLRKNNADVLEFDGCQLIVYSWNAAVQLVSPASLS